MYSFSLVSDPTDEMSRSVTGMPDDVKEECNSAMLHDIINIYLLMVHAQQVKETRAKRKSKNVKRAKSFDGGSSNGRIDIQHKPSFKKGFSNQVPSKFPKALDDRVSNPKP